MESNPKPCCSANRPVSAMHDTHNVPCKTHFSKIGMVKIAAGTFLMGTDDGEGFAADGEGPVREVVLSDYYIDTTAVTNEMFCEFIMATNYKTDAEKYGWSFVFEGLLSKEMADTDIQVVEGTPWWWVVPGACWFCPEGGTSNISGRLDHPVVHVSWNDAVCYCKWAGKRLPAEAEWEKAARGGLVQNKFPWGNELTPGGNHRCNIWQGNFPYHNTLEDGHLGTAPAKSYEPNGFGLYNTSGNVWEWCNDWFSNEVSRELHGPVDGNAKVIKGGSFLCHYSYCNRYRVAARSSNTPDSSASNMGFRCAAN